MTIGERIKAVRLEKKMTLEELGNRIGVSKPTMQRYESGVITLTTDRVQQIAEALEVDPNYLMGWVDDHDDDNTPETIKQIIVALSSLSEDRQQEALRYLRYLSDQPDN